MDSRRPTERLIVSRKVEFIVVPAPAVPPWHDSLRRMPCADWLVHEIPGMKAELKAFAKNLETSISSTLGNREARIACMQRDLEALGAQSAHPGTSGIGPGSTPPPEVPAGGLTAMGTAPALCPGSSPPAGGSGEVAGNRGPLPFEAKGNTTLDVEAFHTKDGDSAKIQGSIFDQGSGGLFGQSSWGGIFDKSSGSDAGPSSSGSLFGMNSGGLFGQSSSGGIFGKNSGSDAGQSTTDGIVGMNYGGLFGQSSSVGIFGKNYGSNGGQSTTDGIFGMNSGGLFGQSSSGGILGTNSGSGVGLGSIDGICGMDYGSGVGQISSGSIHYDGFGSEPGDEASVASSACSVVLLEPTFDEFMQRFEGSQP